MLRLLVAFVFILSFTYGHSQARFGILAGPHSASVFEDNSVPDWFTVRDYYSSRFSFHGGVFVDIPFSPQSPVHFFPVLKYSGKGRKFEPKSGVPIASHVTYVNKEQFVNYLDIPLNIILKFPIGKNSKFVFGGGPQPSFLIGGKETTKIIEDDGSINVQGSKKPEKGSGPGQYKGLDFGLNGQIGFE
ncbi:MAG: outer membrane beta-barrel protein, partial [Chitinophagaceae bacterium]|nr:outer membrane beta-barrel protein [Chitinophagaceae bacterium]